MRKLFYPDLYVDKLGDIPLSRLQGLGIEGLILDLDNTVTGWNQMTVLPEVVTWVKKARGQGFAICLLSNNAKHRVAPVASQLGVPFVSKAGKPRRQAFRQALQVLALPRDQVAAVGDQVFTDVLGGNRAGVYTVLVTPLDKLEFLGTRIMRAFERLVLRNLSKYTPGDEN